MEQKNKFKAKKEVNIEGLVPPQAQDIELAVLGAILLESECLKTISDFLKPEMFYNEVHSKVYNAILYLHKMQNPVDMLTVLQVLKKEGELENVGGAYFVSQLTDRVAGSTNAEYHARIIQQKYLQRELIRISQNVIKSAYIDEDVFEIIEKHEKDLTSLSKNFNTGKIKNLSSLMKDMRDHNEVLLNKKGLIGVPSGFYDIDSLTGGWQDSDLIILAARPAMGKTAFLCNIFRNAATDFNKPGIIFSLEMNALQLMQRMVSIETGVSSYDFTVRGIQFEQWLHVEKDCTRLVNSKLFIDDTPGISLGELRSKAREMKRKHNIQWIAVDYLQLMTVNDKSQNREQEIAAISRGLKGLAKELNLPIVALSQLSRAVESRGGDKRPQLSDLRESGAIEQDADMVIFLHRPEYYGQQEYSNGETTIGVAEVIFAKNRKGAIGTEKLKFINHLTKFESLNTIDYVGNQSSAIKPNIHFSEPRKSNEDDPF